MGFNAGVFDIFFSVPGSRTADIVNIDTSEGSFAVGRWLFRIDRQTILQGSCQNASTFSGEVVTVPRFGLRNGGKRIFIAGPCFGEASVVCNFGGVQVIGTVESDMRAFCIAPHMTGTGTVNLRISIDGGATYISNSNFFFGESISK